MSAMSAKHATDDRGAQQGFMYVEVLVSMVILAFALLAIAPMFILAERENASARDQTFATTLANEQAESLKRVPYDDVVAGEDEVQIRSMTYDRTWAVDDDTPHPGIKTVTVTVVPRRPGGHGGARVSSMSFYRVETE